MKRNIGSKPALYPMPVIVVGAMNGDEPTWTLVAHTGIPSHSKIMVSLAGAHSLNRASLESTGAVGLAMICRSLGSS